MKRWRVSAVDPDPDALREAAALLRDGAVLLFPTDTLYGLGVDPARHDAVAAVFELKGRGVESALPLVAADQEQAAMAGQLTPLARRLASGFWPGPLTVVVEASARLSPAVQGPAGSVAVRVPAHAVARGLAGFAGFPITATSANRSGQAPHATADEALAGLAAGGVAGVVDAGPTPGGMPSTIVDARGDRPVLLRPGAVPFEQVMEWLDRQ